MRNKNKSNLVCLGRLWLLMLLWLPLQALAVAPRLSMEPFTIQAGGTKSVTIQLDNPDTPITLLQFDVDMPNGLSLLASEEGYAVNIAGRTLWRYHSVQASRLANGRYRVLLSSSTNTLLEGTSGAVISLTFKAEGSFSGGQLSLKDILMVSPEGKQFEQNTYNCTVTAKPQKEIGTARLSCNPISIGIGEEAKLAINMDNANEEITLVQFDVTLPEGVTLTSTSQGYNVSMAGRTNERSHALHVSKLANGSFRVLLSSNSNTPVTGSSGAIVQLTLKAAETFSGGQVTVSNILMVSPNEQEAVQASFTQVINSGPVIATGISLNLNKTVLDVGETLQASHVLQPLNVTVKTVTWKSSNTEVATVTADGLITAIAEGTATITVETTDGSNLSNSKQITVTVLAKSIALEIENTTIDTGNTVQASYSILPSNTTNKNVSWESSKKSVATVDENGLITAIAPGITIITVKTTDGTNLSDFKQIEVHQKATNITIGLSKTGLNAGETLQATCNFEPANVTNHSVRWTSSNPNVATIDANGLITAIGNGTTIISVETLDGSNLTASKELTVSIMAKSITLNVEKDTIIAGNVLQASSTILPANAIIKKTRWESSNKNVATISEDGLITAIAPGTTTITAWTTDGTNLSSSKKITVIRIATGITLYLSKENLNAGESIKATIDIQPEDVTSKKLKWTSIDTKVATVSSNGLITAIDEGKAMITVETTDGSKLSDSKLVTVTVLAKSIAITITQNTINAGETIQASYNILPSNTSNKEVRWESSNENVATVSNNGVISGTGLGTAVITAKTTDGSNLSDSKEITVNEKVLQNTKDGISYICYTWAKNATVSKVSTEPTDKSIPETVAFDDITYQVTAIADSAFSAPANDDGYILSITIPSSVKTVTGKTFDGSRAIATVFNSDATLTQHQIDEIMRISKNALLYVKNSTVLPANELDNVVVDGRAGKIVLVEQDIFHCPQQFTARSISFTHNFIMESGYGKTAGWETIALPFDVETITHETKGNLIPFAAYSASLNGFMPFWLYEFSSNGFVRASSLQANTPYIISLPNNTNYTPEFNTNGLVPFAAANATVKSTKSEDLNQQTRSQGEKTFAPTYTTIEKEKGQFAINAINAFYTTTGGETPGSIFIKGLRKIGPFEGYFSSSNSASSRMPIDNLFVNETTGIDALSLLSQSVNVYSLSGQFIGTLNQAELKKLPAGIYIVNGKKLSIR